MRPRKNAFLAKQGRSSTDYQGNSILNDQKQN